MELKEAILTSFPGSKIVENGDKPIVYPNIKKAVQTKIEDGNLVVFSPTDIHFEHIKIKLEDCTKNKIKDTIMFFFRDNYPTIELKINEEELALYINEILNGIKGLK